ncbi:MAG: hypothetical protein ABI645_08800 [Pseudomonadota bacterium]
MKPRHLLLNAILVTCAAMAVPAATAAGETANGMQELVTVKASNKFDRVLWLRGPKQYSLQFLPVRLIDSRPPANITSPANQGAPGTVERSSFFIGNTIANLRGMDPVFDDPPRILTLIAGRRVGEAQADQPPVPRIQAWLLRADGTQILPTWNAQYRLYSIPVAEAVQVVAAAIQIDDEYYIEKLQSLEPELPAQ